MQTANAASCMTPLVLAANAADCYIYEATNIATSLFSLYSLNGTARFKNVNNYLNTNIYSYLEASSGQSSNLYLNVVHFFNTSVN